MPKDEKNRNAPDPDDGEETLTDPEQESLEQGEDSKQPPRDEASDPEPPPGMGSVEKDRKKGQGQAPLPRDSI